MASSTESVCMVIRVPLPPTRTEQRGDGGRHGLAGPQRLVEVHVLLAVDDEEQVVLGDEPGAAGAQGVEHGDDAEHGRGELARLVGGVGVVGGSGVLAGAVRVDR